MNKTRFTPWVVLVCMSALAACTSGEGGTAGNTELNVVVPNNESSPGVPAPIDIQSVEYTINCLGNSDVFLDNGDSFADEVILNGNLEIVDGRTDPQGPIPPEFGTARPGDGAEVWQAFMDLPPGPCTIQLRARDNDNEVICTATESFSITADTTAKVNLVLICDVSFQAPVGMLDVDATFSFIVGNFCPDLFVFNVIDGDPQEQIVNTILGPISIALTTAEVRYRDGDSTCGEGCDPQTCSIVPEGLSCAPGPDPGVSTTITCTSNPGPGENETALIDCTGDFIPDPSCTLTGDTLGVLLPFPGVCAGAGTPCSTDADCTFPDFCVVNPQLNFSAIVGCAPPLGVPGVIPPGTPGAVITCTAVTTDGDVDCDKTKVLTYTCPGLSPCETLGGGPGTCDDVDCPACDDGNDCTANTCSGAAVCGNAPLASGTTCTSQPAPAQCDGAGTCVSQNCNAPGSPPCDDGNECTIDTCDAPPGTTCTFTPNPGASCNGGTGTCNAGGTCDDNCLGVDCSDANDCTADVCDNSTAPGTCSNPNEPSGTPCSGGSGNCDGAGTCVVLTPFSFAATSNAIDMCCNNNALPQQSIIPIQLDIGAIAGNVGGAFAATLGGVLTFPESFLDVAQTVVVGGVQTADLIAAQVTVAPRSGVTGANVAVPPVFPAGLCLISGTACDVANNVPSNGNTDCLPQGSFNPCQRLITVPTTSSLAACLALDPPGCTPGTDCTKSDQHALNGFCVTGALPIPLDPQVGNYTAGSSGQTMLFGWQDTGVPGATNTGTGADGSVTIGTPVFTNPVGPNGLKVNASGLSVAIECIMAVETGDLLTDPVTCGTTPDAALTGYLLP